MINATDTTVESLLKSSLWGMVRGFTVQPLIAPIDAIKVHQQLSHDSQSTVAIARNLFQEGGIKRFYPGLPPELLKTTIRQGWCWPMVVGIPHFLHRYPLDDLQKQLITGLSIATTDAMILTPLEKRKITSLSTNKSHAPLFQVYKEGWRGLPFYWSKLSVNWATFLISQQYLRSQAQGPSKRILATTELVTIGLQVALIVSVVSAPFDIATTLKLARNQNLTHFLRERKATSLFRGFHLHAASRVIHNVASLILIDWLNR